MTHVSATHKKLGQTIKRLRTERGLTQEELAFQVGVDRSYMGFIERGERNPSLEKLIKLSKVLKVSLETLFR